MSVAILLASGACALAAGGLSGRELEGAYRDGGRQQLLATARATAAGLSAGDLREPAVLRRRLSALVAGDGGVHGTSVRDASGSVIASVGGATAAPVLSRRAAATGRPAHAERRSAAGDLAWVAVPLGDSAHGVGTVEVTGDFSPYARAVARRNRGFLLALGGLLLGFTAVTALVLDRGIFSPLHRLRLATRRIAGGRLETRLGWTRRDELGELAYDFDAMAAELEQHNRRLEALVLRDPLTGLANHRHFQEQLADEIEHASRHGRPLALAMIDLDGFKCINDARGHPFGDEVLAGTGAVITRELGGAGFAARLGGDEFALLLPGRDGEEAVAVCDAVRAAVRHASPEDFELTCSAGIAWLPDDARDAESLVQLADGALYWAKDSGRDCTRRYDPEHVLTVTGEQRAEFAGLVESRSSVRAVFQPIVALADGRVAGYESLARFDARRRLPPSWWFEQAHRFGLGPALEATAMEVALEAPGRPAGAFLSVNLSPSALLSEEIDRVLPARLDGLVIEVTEHERIRRVDELHAVLDGLRARGARIAVDDAGGGYAGLQQVMRMRADLIKLDRALIEGVHLDRTKAALVSALVHFAWSTGAELCAEGIEELEELRLLARLGVTYGQGYVLARPGEPWAGVDPAAAETLVAESPYARHHAAA